MPCISGSKVPKLSVCTFSMLASNSLELRVT